MESRFSVEFDQLEINLTLYLRRQQLTAAVNIFFFLHRQHRRPTHHLNDQFYSQMQNLGSRQVELEIIVTMTLEIYRRTQIGYSHYEPRGMSYDHKWTTASFNLPPEGIAQKENKLDCFEHKHICCSKLQCLPFMHCPLVANRKTRQSIV